MPQRQSSGPGRKKLYTLKAGDCLYIAPFNLHEAKQIENSELYVMQISKKFLEDCRIGIDYDICCNSLLDLSGNYEVITELMPKIRELYRINDDKDFLKITALLYELMYQLVTQFSFPIELENHQQEQPKFQEVLQILSYIKKNYSSGLKQQTVAHFFGYNAQYFARFFKRYVGSTFLEYLNSIQIEAACRMLEKTNLRIIDISEECGFHSVKSFNRGFHKIYQMNPSAYRKSVSE